uniref:solute carrier family 25 member 32b isoform X2 n=1 Tax=Pristiophorus japonicus TaxID=55135 RepID=UPI00398E35BC
MSSGSGQAPEPELKGPTTMLRLLQLVKYENLLAGVSGGVVSTLMLHPLDLVKIRFAVSDGLKMRPKYNGIMHCISCIWKHDGIRGLYQGVTPNVWGAGLSWGFYFFFYNAIKAYKQDGRPTQLSATQHLISAAEAGAVTLCITNPIWVTKTRLVLQYDAGVDPSKRQYKGMFHALLKIYKNEGIRGLYKGFVPGLFGTSHGALQFMAYEELKKDFCKYKNVAADAKLFTLLVRLKAGFGHQSDHKLLNFRQWLYFSRADPRLPLLCPVDGYLLQMRREHGMVIP